MRRGKERNSIVFTKAEIKQLPKLTTLVMAACDDADFTVGGSAGSPYTRRYWLTFIDLLDDLENGRISQEKRARLRRELEMIKTE